MNELHKIDQLHETISNDENDKLIWSSQHKNLNFLHSLPSDVRRNGNVRNFWGVNSEKGCLTRKIGFCYKKGRFYRSNDEKDIHEESHDTPY